MRFDTPAARLRTLAFVEGISFLVLLFVAMPLKYFFAMPIAVSIVGAVHGALFVWLFWLVWQGMNTRGKDVTWAARIGVASLLPFGTFFIDRGLAAEEAADRASRMVS
ncbi:MAG TPA: DUF3817 domain-containing protein [Planctomycetota bacterium]|nr:DUF3817 domain-containing protein [Planctomycetota bacterium]